MANQSGKRQWEAMEPEQWRDSFRRNYSKLVSSLTAMEVNVIATRLFSQGMLIIQDVEHIQLRYTTSTEAAHALIDCVMVKDIIAMYSFVAVLKNDLHRYDLVEALDIEFPCRVNNKTNIDKEHKFFTWKSSWISVRQSCSFYDPHSVFEYHLPLISVEFKKMTKEKKMERVEFYEIPISPEILRESDAIQKLTISRQELARVGFQLQNCKNITTLRIIHCKLTEIPQEVMCLTKLEELDLHGNRLISPNITYFSDHLPKLKALDVRDCGLNEIPDWFGNLLQLEELLISGNSFTEGLGRSLERLKMLRYLDVEYCSLQDLPDWMAKLNMLQEIYLSGNNFSKGIIPAIGQLHRLKKLDLSRCSLSTLPASFGDLEQLEELNMSNNNITTGLNEAIGQFRHLKALYIGRCDLLTIPDWITSLDQLQEIDLSKNNFSDGINPATGQLHRLKKLDLSQCSLSTLPTSFRDLEQLEELNLSNNSFTTGLNEAIGRFRYLKALYISQCGLLTLPDWITNLDLLEDIDLSINDFSKGINPAIGQLLRLKKLDLSQCNLSTLPSSFGDLEQLITLTLKDNRLKVYPECTLRLSNLQRLDISLKYSYRDKHLGITILPVKLSDSRLSELILDGNPITEPPKEIWQQGLGAIKSYFKEQRHGIAVVIPDTINMIGDVCAGKSSIAKSLQELSPQPADAGNRTRVLEQLQVNFGKNREWLININDFGGHAIYHSVISIFLPTDGLVILAYDMSKEFDEQSRAVKPWLLTVISKTKKIRMIVVGTHADRKREMQEKLTKDMENFISKVLNDAKDEIVLHKNNLKKELTDDAKQEWISMIERKLQQLEELLERLGETSVRVVSLSCSSQDDELQKLHLLVSNMLRTPIEMPRRWSAVMEDITSATSKCHYLQWNEVQAFYKSHVADVEGDGDLIVILRYLASTSQIIWLENHNTLGNVVFNAPQKIIEVCKNVLHHDRARSAECSEYAKNEPYQQWPESWATMYPKDVERYAQGIVHRPFMNILLSADDQQVDIAVDFLKKFNLISEIKPDRRDRRFVIPSNLSKEQPKKKIDAFNRHLNESSERLIMKLSFMGAVIPKSFFETSVSSMLSAAHELTKHEFFIDAWHEGLLIEYKDVWFEAKRKDNRITLIALSKKSSEMDPWTLLRPVFQRLHRYIIGTWHGALPDCDILCPACHLKSLQITNSGCEKIGKFQRPFEILSCVSLTETYNSTCPECYEPIPRLLCLPITRGENYSKEPKTGETSLDSKESTVPDEGAQETTGDSSPLENDKEDIICDKTRERKPDRESNENTLPRTLNEPSQPCPPDIMDEQQLHRTFQKSYDILTSSLTLAEVNQVANFLYSQNMLIRAELEEVHSIRTAIKAASNLVDVILTKNEKLRYCAFVYVLHNDLGRSNLLAVCFSKDELKHLSQYGQGKFSRKSFYLKTKTVLFNSRIYILQLLVMIISVVVAFFLFVTEVR